MNSPSESYEDFLTAQLVDTPAQGAQGFVVDDDHKASWALRKLAQIEAQRAADEAYQRVELAQLQAWAEHRQAQRQRFHDYLTSLLRAYWDQLAAEDRLGGRRSYVLPHGRLQVRTQEAKFVRDDDVLLKSLDGRYTRIKAEVDWQALKAEVAPVSDQPFAECVLTDTGEVLAGLRLQSPPSEQFSAKPSVD